MKRYAFDIDKYQAEWIFSPIRNRRDVISILMKTLKIMSLNLNIKEVEKTGKIILVISKMSRIFYVSEAKVFSICFPFFVQEGEHGLVFKCHAHSDINNRVTSEILALLDSSQIFENGEVLNFAEPIFDACIYDNEIWSLFRDLLITEDGYIRYDVDEERSDGHLHPLHHLDIFYSTSSTFKLGLSNQINQINMEDILDANTNCHYVEAARIR